MDKIMAIVVKLTKIFDEANVDNPLLKNSKRQTEIELKVGFIVV